jgi:hypothetical protein
MVNVRHYRPAGTTPDAPALALFQKQWQLYRKVRFDAANFPPSYSVDPYPDKTVHLPRPTRGSKLRLDMKPISLPSSTLPDPHRIRVETLAIILMQVIDM